MLRRKPSFPSKVEGYIALHMSVDELIDRHIGRFVGKSVSLELCNIQQDNAA